MEFLYRRVFRIGTTPCTSIGIYSGRANTILRSYVCLGWDSEFLV